MKHIVDVVVDRDDKPTTPLVALCGATGTNLHPQGTRAADLCPRCAALAGR